jgi:NAD(P)-dependent dehydrogenase (short-subunit alcohol dehydrogenase family)
MGKLSGKVALITGGTTGIGLATARLFAQEGATVIVTGRNPNTVEAARKELGRSATVVASDAGDGAQIRELFDAVAREHGRIDVLFLNAGLAKFAPLEAVSEALIDELVQVNFKGPFLSLQAALPLLGKGASVIVNTTVAAERGVPNASAYSASKGALSSLAQVAAVELAGRGIRVNAVRPGPITTPILGKAGLSPEQREAFVDWATARVPLGRFGSADEVARAALFLASDDSAFVTGHELTVDGGMMAA